MTFALATHIDRDRTAASRGSLAAAPLRRLLHNLSIVSSGMGRACASQMLVVLAGHYISYMFAVRGGMNGHENMMYMYISIATTRV